MLQENSPERHMHENARHLAVAFATYVSVSKSVTTDVFRSL